mgnify:CR=1 FL=1
MPPISLAVPTGRYLSFEEREEIALDELPRDVVTADLDKDGNLYVSDWNATGRISKVERIKK